MEEELFILYMLSSIVLSTLMSAQKNGCAEKSASETTSETSSIRDTTKQNSTIANTDESTSTPSSESKTVEPIEAKDYTVTDGMNIITLDSPYKDFKINYEEKKIDNNYVGETTSGDAIY